MGCSIDQPRLMPGASMWLSPLPWQIALPDAAASSLRPKSAAEGNLSAMSLVVLPALIPSSGARCQ